MSWSGGGSGSGPTGRYDVARLVLRSSETEEYGMCDAPPAPS